MQILSRMRHALAAAAALSMLSVGALAEPVLPIDIDNRTDCDITFSVAPHKGQVAAPAGQVARLLVEAPPQADGSNSVYRLSSRSIAEGCDTKLAKVEQDWVLVRTPEGGFFVDPADPAKPDEKSSVGSGTPTFLFATDKGKPIALSLTTQ
ncbi:MAG: hypothetical protein RIB84_17440 [Sneathiellaceae bacterium]